MPTFSESSKARLLTCEDDLQRLFNEVIKHFDCSVLCGHRTKEAQESAYNSGASESVWPNSKHNSLPSRAIDVILYPIDWNDTNRIYMFVGVVRGIAATMGIKIRYGADWDGDMETKDQNFNDLVHFELV